MAVKVVPASEMVNQKGVKFEPGPWITLDQERINQFADVTDDHQFIHIDQEKAAQTPFGTTIAHGYLTLSLVVPMVSQIYRVDGVRMGVNYGTNKVRFPAPVPVGADPPRFPFSAARAPWATCLACRSASAMSGCRSSGWTARHRPACSRRTARPQ